MTTDFGIFGFAPQKTKAKKKTEKKSPPKETDISSDAVAEGKDKKQKGAEQKKKTVEKAPARAKRSGNKQQADKEQQPEKKTRTKKGASPEKEPAATQKAETATKNPVSKAAPKKGTAIVKSEQENAAESQEKTAKKGGRKKADPVKDRAKKQAVKNTPAPAKAEEKKEELPEITLSDLPELLQDACAGAGWESLTPVQSKAIPYFLEKQDIMVQSRTGSGKTGTFILPALSHINSEKAACQLLVLVPTRELASQVAAEALTLSKNTGVCVAAVYGGTEYASQLTALKKGAHIVVGTPGRILDHLLRGSLSLSALQMLVFDEADRMLSIGFYPDMKQIQRYLPARDINVFMTSATYPPHVKRLAGEFMKKERLLSLSQSSIHVAETPHAYYEVSPMEKDRALIRIIELENPASAFIFCNTKQTVHYITAVLQRFGHNADELSGDLTQQKREQVLTRIRKGELRYLVATDVAARGIDIPYLSHVFLYEPPEDHEVYIHRAGRTGRAGAAGEVVSLVDVMEKLALEKIARTYKINLEHRVLPTDEDVQGAIGRRVSALLEVRLRGLDNVEKERLARFLEFGKELMHEENGPKLMAMLLDSVYQQSLGEMPQAPVEKQSKRPGNRGARPRRGSAKK